MVMRLSLEGDRVKAAAFSGKAQQELDRLQARMDSAQLDRGTFHYTLDDESYVYGYILPGGLRCARIVCTPGVGEVKDVPVPIADQIPDFLSGYVRDGSFEAAEPDDGNPLTEERPLSIKQFVPSAETAEKMKKDLKWAPRNAKLAVAPWVAFDGQGASQYVTITPNMYSGRMRKLVQALMGFGKNPKKKGSFFGREFDFVSEEEKRELKRALPPAYKLEVERFGLQIRFDYRFYRTHGLTTGSDGKQWITEIGMNRGVLVMPLLLHELTTTEKFRKKAEELGRFEALTILDEFGGFPTGEAFPGSPNRVDAWVRAGRVLRLKEQADMTEFYSNSAYSSTNGWAFNSRGTEAHTTAYSYDEGGCQIGVHYMVSINIGVMDTYKISAAAGGLWRAIDGVEDRKEQYEAVKWKVHRLTDEEVSFFLGMLQSKTALEVFDAVDAVVCKPIAIASASIIKVSQGKLYWPTKGGQQQIKFAEPIVDGLESHDFRPSKIQNVYPFCDTTMYVFFAQDQLRYVKYYLDPRRTFPENVSYRVGDPEWDVLYAPVGDFYVAWVRNVAVPPSFYGTDFDPREELPDTIQETFYTRRPLDTTDPWASDDAVAYRPTSPNLPSLGPVPYVLYQTTWFSDDHVYNFPVGQERKSSVTIPFFDREAYYLGAFRRRSGGQRYDTKSYRHVNSPHYAYSGNPLMVVPNYAEIVDNVTYRGGQGGAEVYDYQMEFADNGPLGRIGQDIAQFRHIGWWGDWYFNKGSQIFTEVDPVASYTIDLVTSSLFGKIRVIDETYSGPLVTIIDPLWFLPSPDEFGDYQYIGETHNVLGYVDCIVYGIHLLSGERAHKGSYPQSADWLNSQMNVYAYPTFVGVFDA